MSASSKSLADICFEYSGLTHGPMQIYATDKARRHAYISEFYEGALAKYRERENVVVEIGVLTGGSIRMFCDYFERSQIYGLELNPMPHIAKMQEDNPRIHLIFGDAYSDSVVSQVPNIDIFIDDGPHFIETHIIAINKYMPKMNPGGLFVIEDVELPDFLDVLEAEIPDPLRPYVKKLDLRHMKGQRRDLLFVVEIPDTERSHSLV